MLQYLKHSFNNKEYIVYETKGDLAIVYRSVEDLIQDQATDEFDEDTWHFAPESLPIPKGHIKLIFEDGIIPSDNWEEDIKSFFHI